MSLLGSGSCILLPNSYFHRPYNHPRLRVNAPPAASGTRPQTLFRQWVTGIWHPSRRWFTAMPYNIYTLASHAANGGQPAFDRPPTRSKAHLGDSKPLPPLRMPVISPLRHGCGVFPWPVSVRGRIRTCDLLLRREPLCPIELRGPVFCAVHPAGIEPAASG